MARDVFPTDQSDTQEQSLQDVVAALVTTNTRLQTLITAVGATNTALAGTLVTDGHSVTQPVSVAGTVTTALSGAVDTELPSAVTLTDSLGNPTTPVIGSVNLVHNGSSLERVRTPKVFKSLNGVAIATESAIWTPTSGKKFRLMGLLLAVSVAGSVILKDNTGGSTIIVVPGLAATPVILNFGNGILSSAADQVLTATGPALSVLSGIVFGTEE